jgi:DNA-binding transcriptional MerR regulator
MGKTITQIAFSFGSEPESPVKTKAPVKKVVKKAAAMEKKPKKNSVRGRRSLKDIAARADLIEIPEDEVLFSKQYYSISEVAKMFRENQSLIRYWETEFDILQPRKNKKGDRFFRPADVKNLVLIYDLLRRRKFTIEGAKDFLKKNKNADARFEMIRSLEKVKSFLLELKASL